MQARPRPDSPAIDVDGSVRLPGTAVRSGESGPRARTRPNPRQRFGRSGTRPARFHLRRSSAPAIGAVRAPSVRRAHLDPMAERSTSLGATRVRCHVARRGRRCVRCGRSRRRAVAPCAQDPGSRRSASPGNPAAQRRRRVPGLFEKPSLCRDHLICTVPKRRVSNVRRVSSVRLTGAARRSRRSAHLVSVRVFATFASEPIRRGRRCAFESSTPMSRHSKKSQRRGRGSGNDQGREAATAAAPQRRMTGGSRATNCQPSTGRMQERQPHRERRRRGDVRGRGARPAVPWPRDAEGADARGPRASRLPRTAKYTDDPKPSTEWRA